MDELELTIYSISAVALLVPLLFLMYLAQCACLTVTTLAELLIVELVLLIVILALVPVHALVEHGMIKVKTPLRKRVLCSVNEVTTLRKLDRIKIRHVISRRLPDGTQIVPVTRKCRNVFLIVTKSGKAYIINPRDEEELVKALSKSSQDSY